MQNKKGKRKYEQKLITALALDGNRDFLINNFKMEWEEVQKDINRKERIEKIETLLKKSGVAIGKTVLGLALFGGVLTAVMVAPKIFVLFSSPNKYGKRYKIFLREQEFKRAMVNFKRCHYIKMLKKQNDNDENGKVYEIYLEKKGEQRIIKESFNDLTIAKPANWDGIWRMVIFDIPDKHKWAREGLREKLRQLNFYQLQESVFVFPYDCQKEIIFICSVFNINDYVRYLEVKKIIFDEDLKNFYRITN